MTGDEIRVTSLFTVYDVRITGEHIANTEYRKPKAELLCFDVTFGLTQK
jgi:hypothetical protein